MKNAINRLKRFIDEGIDPLGGEMINELEAPEGEETIEAEPKRKIRGATERIKNHRTVNALYAIASVLLCAAMIAILLYNINGLPSFGGADTLVDSEVGRFYIENGLKDTGATNIVTPIILSYRGFDTLGESHVLFIALCAVMILLRSVPSDEHELLPAYRLDADEDEPKEDEILLGFGRVLMTCILVFGLYIILNGNTSPGGGFSGGAVIGAGLILHLNIYDREATARFLNIKSMRAISCTALVGYAAFKGYHFVCGLNGWESIFSNGTAGTIFSGGMMLYLNIFVGAVVSVTMYTLFIMFRKGDF